MTYRSNFPPITRSQDPAASAGITLSVRLRNLAERDGFSSDTGWGCMIRSGQSLLANALVMLQLGRDWRRRTNHLKDDSRVVSLFADSPKAPFSIHKFVQHGASACGKHPGNWFGPSATASCIKLVTLCQPCPTSSLNLPQAIGRRLPGRRTSSLCHRKLRRRI
jgi:cysteine protease ATG4